MRKENWADFGINDFVILWKNVVQLLCVVWTILLISKSITVLMVDIFLYKTTSQFDLIKFEEVIVRIEWREKWIPCRQMCRRLEAALNIESGAVSRHLHQYHALSLSSVRLLGFADTQ